MMRLLSKPRPRAVVYLTLLTLVIGGLLLPPPVLATPVGEQLRERLEALPEGSGRLAASGEAIHAERALRAFYTERLFAPAWSDDDGARMDRVTTVRDLLELADVHGPSVADYHAEAIDALLEQAPDDPTAGWLADLDLLVTDSYLLLASHLALGRLDPVSLDPQWFATRQDLEPAKLLKRALDEDTLQSTIEGLLPASDEYARLLDAYAAHRDMAADGGWPRVPEGPTLRRGDEGERVLALAQRLHATGELRSEPGSTFDSTLHEAVQAFQRRHGLEPDGLVGPNTRRALNISATDRAEQIRVNLERWRWLPRDLGERHIRVNIAGFDMVMVDRGEEVFSSRVIVGRDYRRTPVFNGRMTYLVLNPSWEVPNSIAVNDIIPQIRQDPDYLDRMGFRVLRGWGADEREIDPTTVDWNRMGRNNMPFRFRQSPGPLNALGQVKFMFPNRFNVYLHDTPARNLFDRARRDFSSGCIRVENPMELTRVLLDDSSRWDRAAIDRVIDGKREQTVSLRRPVQTHMQYATTWVDDDGRVQFREDIYSRDEPVRAALAALPPRPVRTGR